MRHLEVFWVFLKLGCTSFGGPIAHLVYFREAFVHQRKWLTEYEYSNLLTLCQTLPGPASSQVGFSIGLMRAGILGACLAFIAFTLPSVILLLVFANYLFMFDAQWGQAVLQGLAILAFVVVSHGVVGMGQSNCSERRYFSIALFSFVSLIMLPYALTQLLVIALGALIAYVYREKANMTQSIDEPEQVIVHVKWLKKAAPILGLTFVLLLFTLPILSSTASDFYRSGALVFGGGHVVLPLLESAFVSIEQISQADFLAGYGATQAVPGPMFSFAAYLGYLLPGSERPLIQAFVATVFIFLPGFLLVMTILPSWQRLSHSSKNKAAFAGANAAVVGLLAAALYDPIFVHAITQPLDIAIAAVAYAGLSRYKVSVLYIVMFCVMSKLFLTIV
ncbi:chromate efflux transporter [Glaciecola sp. XM2]|uniref:chromate efflux transporter n=1 Tax=Glaciecola sp. XM2 TaxID=1914931 RepID=UPI001BDE4A23|nr:chromate efflux transporter [Glaciecola sp. XM2]MBT1451039.1 chromate efflux transporter [Glaciecola sp. XM2]